MPTIFSVGYQKLTPTKLMKLVKDLDCVLIDCRSYPSGRVKKGFSRLDLTAALGAGYEWRGDQLGGKGRSVTREGLDRLKADGRRLLLLCMEHYPSDCHRHRSIALPLADEGVIVRHVFEDEVIDAPDLQKGLMAEAAYEYESLADVIAEARGEEDTDTEDTEEGGDDIPFGEPPE